MAVDSTWGGPTANSYVDLTTAHSFLLTFVFDSSAWTSATTAQREASLAEATVVMDQFPYVGTRYYSDQRLAFPRAFPGEYETFGYSTSVGTPTTTFQVNMKDAVQRACAYQALHVCRLGGIDADYMNRMRGISSYSEEVGPVRESASYSNQSGGAPSPSARLSPDAFSLLGPYRTSKRVFRA